MLCRRNSAVIILALITVSASQRIAPAEDRVFWTDSGSGRIERANLDGSNRVTLLSGITPLGIAVDAEAGLMYWSEFFPARIRRADLDGLGVVDLVTRDLIDPVDIELDPLDGKMYWTEPAAGLIRRANLDGSDVELLIIGDLFVPVGLALDIDQRMMYWTDSFSRQIQRAPMDGGNPESLLADISGPSDIEVDRQNRKMIWTQPNAIRRADLDGSNTMFLFIASGISPVSLEIDFSVQMMYFIDRDTPSVLAADYGGTHINVIAGDLIAPQGIALELDGGRCDACDMNCDGDVNAIDIEPFLDLLFRGGRPCDRCTGDVNGDGAIDAFDIEPFLNCLFP